MASDSNGSKPVALVTGASGGLGTAIASALAQTGFDLILNDVTQSDALEAVCASARSRGARAVPLPQDISRVDELDGFVERANQALGGIDCLVNNAGVSVLSRGDILDVSVESFDHCMDVNLRGTFFLTQRVARSMLSRPRADPAFRRSIITISTVAVDNVLGRDLAEYCISKTGLVHMTKLMAIRLVEHGIDCYDVRPGMTRTEMSAKSKEKYDALIASGFVPARRWGTAEDVGATIANLATGVLRYAVGQTINIDGGMPYKTF